MKVRAMVNRSIFNAGVLAIYMFLLAPIVVIVVLAFDPSPRFDFPPHGLSLRWFEAFFQKSGAVSAFFEISLPVALATAAIATPLGLLAALGLGWARFKGKSLLEAYLILPVLVPEVILAISLSLLFIQAGLQKSLATLVLAHVLVTVPFVIRTVSSSLHGVGKSLEEAAVMLGATRLQTFFYIVLPLIRSGVISGALFSFIISFGDINFALFLSGPNTMNVPVYIFSELQWGTDPTIAVISAMQIFVVAAIIILIGRFAKVRFSL